MKLPHFCVFYNDLDSLFNEHSICSMTEMDVGSHFVHPAKLFSRLGA